MGTWARTPLKDDMPMSDVEAAVVPAKVQSMMVEYDQRARHYETADGEDPGF